MAIPHNIVTDLRRYQVVTDLHLPFLVLAWGRVTDLTTGRAPLTGIVATTDLPHSVVRVFEDGFWCVAGVPERCFEDLTIANSFIVALTLGGYTDETVMVNVSTNPVWPVDAGTQPLRPLPVRLQGRVIAKLTGLPAANGRVITVDPVGPPLAPRPFLLRSTLKQDHTTAASIQGITLTALAFVPTRVLDQDSQPGSAMFVINDRTGLVAGQVVRFQDDRSGEYGRIASISTVPVNPALPGEVILEAPMSKSFPRTTPLDVFTAGANVGPSRILQRAASAGEGVLQINDYPSGDVLRLIEAGLFPEFHAPGALTDADGYFAIDGIARIARMFVGVEALGFASPAKAELRIMDYKQAVNLMDFRLV